MAALPRSSRHEVGRLQALPSRALLILGGPRASPRLRGNGTGKPGACGAGPVAYASTGLTQASSPALLQRDSSAPISSLIILIRLPGLSSLPPASPGGAEAQGGCVDGEGGACAGRRGRSKFCPVRATEGICQDLLLPFQRKPGVGAWFKFQLCHNPQRKSPGPQGSPAGCRKEKS